MDKILKGIKDNGFYRLESVDRKHLNAVNAALRNEGKSMYMIGHCIYLNAKK